MRSFRLPSLSPLLLALVLPSRLLPLFSGYLLLFTSTILVLQILENPCLFCAGYWGKTQSLVLSDSQPSKRHTETLCLEGKDQACLHSIGAMCARETVTELGFRE